jgi:hypothetical protein
LNETLLAIRITAAQRTKEGYFLAMHHFLDWSSFPHAKFEEFVAERETVLKQYLEKILS